MNEREIVCEDLNLAIDDLRRRGFRLDLIYPADDPHSAQLSKGVENVRLTCRPDAPPPPDALPRFTPEFVVTRASSSSGEGRAGLLYRDLIPSRLGGRYIASHISIPEGGLVADWIHYHRVALQMIHVRRGWVQVVYEDQGEPFVMTEGDLVLQPPEIRHRVLESSEGLEVVEVTAPALHATFADHELELPNGSVPERSFGGQCFLRHVADHSRWCPLYGGEAQETGLGMATAELSNARTIRPGAGDRIDFPAHAGELVFGFVLDGSASLEFRGRHEVNGANSFVIPPGEQWSVIDASQDFRLLHITTARLD